MIWYDIILYYIILYYIILNSILWWIERSDAHIHMLFSCAILTSITVSGIWGALAPAPSARVDLAVGDVQVSPQERGFRETGKSQGVRPATRRISRIWLRRRSHFVKQSEANYSIYDYILVAISKTYSSRYMPGDMFWELYNLTPLRWI